MDIKRARAVGCGLMRAGIARVVAQAGYDTIRERLRELDIQDEYEPMVASASISVQYSKRGDHVNGCSHN